MVSAIPTTAIADAAGESGIVTDEDALFGEAADEETSGFEEELFGEADDGDATFIREGTSTAGIDTSLLVSESVEIGGKYSFSASSSWNIEDFPDFTEGSASVDLSATLFFDARPSEDFRVFGETTISYPFDKGGGAREFDDVFHVDELFSDFNWNETFFFRGGKHTIN